MLIPIDTTELSQQTMDDLIDIMDIEVIESNNKDNLLH